MAIPHFSYPFHIANGSVAVHEQDTYEDVAQSVAIILASQRGDRIELPEFGVESPLFKSESVGRASEYLGVIDQWEPRAQATLQINVDNMDDTIQIINAQITDRVEDNRVNSLPRTAVAEEGDGMGYGEGGWGLEPWGF